MWKKNAAVKEGLMKLFVDNISMGVQQFYKKECEKSEEKILTPVCDEDCDHNCGICGKELKGCKQKRSVLLYSGRGKI